MRKFLRSMALLTTVTVLFTATACNGNGDAKTTTVPETTVAADTTTAADVTDATDTGDEADVTEASENTESEDIGTKDPTKLVMGTNAQFPPFEYTEGSTITGIDADLMAAIADELGVELVIEDMEFNSLPAALANGQIDIIAAGFTVNPDREETMDFTSTYYEARQTLIVLSDSGYTSIDDLTDKVIGGQDATTGLLYCATEYTADANIKAFANGMLAVEALLNGSVDGVIIDNNPAKVYGEKYAGQITLIEDQFDPEDYAMAVKKGNTVLQTRVNEALAAIIADGRFDEICSNHLA